MMDVNHAQGTWRRGRRDRDGIQRVHWRPRTAARGGWIASWCTAAGAAWAAALVWLVRLPSFFVLGQGSTSLLSREASALLGVAPHLLLFPVVAALPAPRWVRHAAYGWLVLDIATDVMALNGVPQSTYLALRYGGHVAAALWFAAAAWRAEGGTRVVGLLLALNLGGYSFAAPLDPTHFVGLLPMMVLLPLWLALVGRRLARTMAPRHDLVAVASGPAA